MRRAPCSPGQVGVRSDPPVVEEPVRPTCPMLKVSSLVAVFVFFLASAPRTPAQEISVSGRYQCAQAKVRGKVVPCTAAPLTLRDDGHFELRGWEGNYLVTGQWVELSDSSVKSRAKIEPGHKIVFRYRGKHGWCEMIYQRRVADLGKTSLS